MNALGQKPARRTVISSPGIVPKALVSGNGCLSIPESGGGEPPLLYRPTL